MSFKVGDKVRYIARLPGPGTSYWCDDDKLVLGSEYTVAEVSHAGNVRVDGGVLLINPACFGLVVPELYDGMRVAFYPGGEFAGYRTIRKGPKGWEAHDGLDVTAQEETVLQFLRDGRYRPVPSAPNSVDVEPTPAPAPEIELKDGMRLMTKGGLYRTVVVWRDGGWTAVGDDGSNRLHGTAQEREKFIRESIADGWYTVVEDDPVIPPPAPRPAAWLNSLSSEERKEVAVARGLFAYFPDALALIARHSVRSNEKHNPGQPVHWSREKSSDHEDCIARHSLSVANDPDSMDGDAPHIVCRAWRALAALQLWAEAKQAKGERI